VSIFALNFITFFSWTIFLREYLLMLQIMRKKANNTIYSVHFVPVNKLFLVFLGTVLCVSL